MKDGFVAFLGAMIFGVVVPMGLVGMAADGTISKDLAVWASVASGVIGLVGAMSVR